MHASAHFCFVFFSLCSVIFFFFSWSFLGVGLNDLRNLCISASSLPLSSSNRVVICMLVCLCNSSVLETPFMRAQIVLLISFGVWTGFSCFHLFVIFRSEEKKTRPAPLSSEHAWSQCETASKHISYTEFRILWISVPFKSFTMLTMAVWVFAFNIPLFGSLLAPIASTNFNWNIELISS